MSINDLAPESTLEAIDLDNVVMRLLDVSVSFRGRLAVKNVSFDVERNAVTALIGPSGSGKTTLLRAINRLHDLTPKASVTGQILVDGTRLYGDRISITELRSRIGMVFQRPNPFPAMSIYDNVASGLRVNGMKKKDELDDAVEYSLRSAALWDSVSPRLKDRSGTLSGGEQQRLCIARALALKPEILLMDEPTASLDPESTARIEALVTEIKRDRTVVIVTHNMEQARRVSDNCAFLLMAEDRSGELIEFDRTARIFGNPRDPRTSDYIAGRFG